MADDRQFARDVAARQIAMFIAFVGPGRHITRAALSAATGYPESSLREYAAGAAMPLHVVLGLLHALPGAAIDMLTEAAGVRFARVAPVATSWDGIAAAAARLASQVCDARADGVIDHQEDAVLRRETRELAALAAGVLEA